MQGAVDSVGETIKHKDEKHIITYARDYEQFRPREEYVQHKGHRPQES